MWPSGKLPLCIDDMVKSFQLILYCMVSYSMETWIPVVYHENVLDPNRDTIDGNMLYILVTWLIYLLIGLPKIGFMYVRNTRIWQDDPKKVKYDVKKFSEILEHSNAKRIFNL